MSRSLSYYSGLCRAKRSRAPIYARQVGLSRTKSASLVELVLKQIADCLERGETVKLSSFGSFVVRKKGQRLKQRINSGANSVK